MRNLRRWKLAGLTALLGLLLLATTAYAEMTSRTGRVWFVLFPDDYGQQIVCVRDVRTGTPYCDQMPAGTYHRREWVFIYFNDGSFQYFSHN